ncbi:hypothetical protein [Lysinibacillus odysseyi]|uniref:Uncharacterized protein n=1 Tax=Lysinibacillus odysseyi 34hs-1 = NBRC 100172 TaxID=1220589 RepID=A0A0A3IUQ1_9BACI|nr:hypothetical protein [Lysinibacillus odysseyi]KGR88416.1 hypothetical protein CD32_01780 [Lysinibacillus odysseyi 34hs-1 = NBRC 100172]
MLELTKKRKVTTRRNHECFGCGAAIEKGTQAIYVTGKEDGAHVNFHLHVDCHLKACKQKLYEQGFEKGSLNALDVSLQNFSVANVELPF